MCGIAGILKLNGGTVAEDLLVRMVGLIGHRGPDARGIFRPEVEPIGLAHARLSVIDLSGGHQPMSNEDGSLWVTFNGEVFNYVELRNQLLARGHQFATQSDTEVLLHMYQENGADCVRDLNGQWAFAIWDAKRRILFLSRDRLGVRPLFYARTKQSFIFASELKSILLHPEVERTIDVDALNQVFTFWGTQAPRTMFRGIHELPPGHSMMVQDGDLHTWPYWSLSYSSIDHGLSEADCADRLLALLTDATRIRLRADVPVGAYLSGGLDSSITTALVKQCTGSRLRTFSIGFEDPEFDESAYQRHVIDLLQTDHQAFGCSYDAIARAFPDVIWHTEKPILRTAPAPLFLLSRLVRDQGYKVVLTGEGADEFLGGYDLFKEAKIRRFWAADLHSRRRALLLKRLYPYLQNLQAQPEAYLTSFFHVRASETADPFFSHLPRWDLTSRLAMFFSDEVRRALAKSDVRAELREALPAGYANWDGLSQAQYLEATTLLPGYILSSQGDRVAMAHSVEGRFPFLDYRVVEFASTIPPRLRLRVLNEKYILKRAAGHLVPESVRKRPKQPYRAPDVKSFFDVRTRRSRQDYIDEMLSGDGLRKSGLFNPLAVQKLVDKARNGKVIGAKDNMALVGILSTQLLVDQFIDRPRRLS